MRGDVRHDAQRLASAAAYLRDDRIDLLVDLTLTDPVTYTRPWKASRKVWGLIPKDKMAAGGWSGILEDRCIPSDESLFNKFRDHAAGKK